MSVQKDNIRITIFPSKFFQKHTDIIIKQIESFEKKTFPKNEVMDIKEEVSKKTNTLLIAYYEQDVQKEQYTQKSKLTSKLNAHQEKRTNKPNKVISKEIIIVGYIIYSNISSTQMPVTRILKLCVHRFFRRIGLGEKLLRSVLERMDVPKRSKADLHVDVERTVAINLYKKVGFNIVKRVVDYYEVGRDAWLMEFIN
jgi:ribosomal protein S18 acetylase RimI-like enzyme